jgi:hypothetical protein
MRRFLIVTVLTLSVFSLFPVNALAASFPDVLENTINYNAVEYLKQKGIISGYPDGTFKPDNKINRAEAMKVLMLASSETGDSAVTPVFSDVKGDEWFYQYLQKAFSLKIVEGYPDGTFKPGNNINMAESLKMIVLTLDNEEMAAVGMDVYPDVTKDLWYASYALVSKTKQLIEPLDDGKLHAEREMTRGQFVQIIYRLMYIKENNLTKFPLDTDWLTFAHPTDHYTIKYPFDWQILQAGKSSIIWKQDTDNGQLSFERIFPNGATLAGVIDTNTDRLSFDDYLNKLPYFSNGVTQKLTLNNYPFASVTIDNGKLIDYYFELPNKSILVIYTEAGNGLNRAQLLNELRYMVDSVRYTEVTSSVTEREKFLSQVRSKILVTGAWPQVLGLFDDIVLIETDAIGIGTGPVDYYYSENYDVTLKLERDSNTLLAISDGKTTAF